VTGVIVYAVVAAAALALVAYIDESQPYVEDVPLVYLAAIGWPLTLMLAAIAMVFYSPIAFGKWLARRAK
jgi:hypothetical protein